MLRPEAISIAKAFVAEIEDCCDRLIVAGSLRRRLAMIGDVEVVAVPKVETIPRYDVFGNITQQLHYDLLDAHMTALLEADTVSKRLDRNGVPRWGPTLKFLTFLGARIDLFCPSIERFGWILMLRTGPATFSRQLVVERGRLTKDGRPGLLPPTLAPREGWLTRRVSGERLVTPDERDVFRLFDLDYLEPQERA
jgi:DNA polymerase/3'-5' exonuclease PolX